MRDADPDARRFDYIVVGAGAAGCALAARLTADPRNSVLLMEAGPDLPPGGEPSGVLEPFPGAFNGAAYTWPNLTVEVFPATNMRPAVRRGFIQGKVIGGSSTINGMMAQRGLPADFDEWEARGASGWGWKGVLPYFNALERDLDFHGPLHGAAGPIPIRRETREDWAPFARAVTEAMLAQGHPFLEDFNGEFGDGISRVPLNNLPDRRVSAAIGYLDAETRRRPNLHIMAETPAGSLLIEGGRAIGVRAARAGRIMRVHAREILVCAGAIHTPCLLLRSGIGPANELKAQGIRVVADHPGVGKNLLNHAMIHVATHLPRDAVQAKHLASWAFTVLRYSSGHEGCSQGDMQIFPINRTSWHPLGSRIGAIGLCLNRPFSAGEVRLASPDPETPPSIKFNMLVDSRDTERLVDGLKRVLDLFEDPRVRPHRNEVFMPDKALAGRLATRSTANLVKTACINHALGTGGWARKLALGRRVLDPQRLAGDREAMRDIVRSETSHVHHVCGTCRLGADGDRMAVVDARCKVRGVEGLRVADASVMPSNISANTHLAAMMIGEKAAAMILDKAG